MVPPVVRRRDVLRAAGAAAVLGACSRAAPSAGPPSDHPSTGTPAGDPSTAATPAASPSSTGDGSHLDTSTADIRHGDRSTPAVALTFHGAGSSVLAHRALAVLDRAGAKVTVFAVGTWLVSDPEAASLVLGSGHELGNHTLHHLPMRRLDLTRAEAEIRGCARELARLTGSPGRWFRPSGTATSTPTIRAAARASGYARCVTYDVDSLDWTDPGADAVVQRVLTEVRPGSIVGMHLGHTGTVAALPRILDGLARRGLRPVTVSRLLGVA